MSMKINSAVYNSLISGNNCYCCLCYSIVEEEAVKVCDEVFVEGDSEPIHLSELLVTVLGYEHLNELQDNQSLCRQCTDSTVQSYIFIKMCKSKLYHMNSAIESMLTSLTDVKANIDNYNLLFLSLNYENYNSNLYYDNKRSVVTREAAYKRYQSLTNPKKRCKKKIIDIDQDYCDMDVIYSEEEKPKRIPTKDMLFNADEPKNAKCKICLKTCSTIVKLRLHYLRTHAPKVLQCSDCHRSYASPTLLQQHTFYTHQPVNCDVCGKEYINRHSLKMHMMNHKDIDASCQYCNKNYKNWKLVKRHIQLNRCRKIVKECICQFCNKKFFNMNRLIVHYNTHFDGDNPKRKIPTIEMIYEDKDKSIKCKGCLRIFRSAKTLRDHYIRAHAPKIFKCPECPRSFGSRAHVKEHQQNSHCAGICNICGKQYSNRNSLKGHLATHKEKATCPKCGRGYKDKNALTRHIEQNACHERGKQLKKDFICDYCSKGFTQRCSLVSHIKLEHENGTAHVCMWCNKRYNCQSRLRVHMVTHTQEKNFTCEICGGKFVTKESLLYHTRIHTGERPYPCQLCDNRFLSASRLTEHIRRRHSIPSLECDICQSKFKVRSSLQKHRMRHFKPTSKLYAAPKLNKEENYVTS